MHPNDLSYHGTPRCPDPKAALRAREERPPPREYKPMELREMKARVVTKAELDAGYEMPAGGGGATERREYRIVAYIVEDPSAD